jgi:hypothetical protein
MRGWRDWLDEHWATAGMVVSIVGALTCAVVLMVAFNIMATRSERADDVPAGALHGVVAPGPHDGRHLIALDLPRA